MTISRLENNWQKYCLHTGWCCVVWCGVERMTVGRALRQWHLGSRIVFADSPPPVIAVQGSRTAVSAHFHRSAGGCPQSSVQWCHQADNYLLLNLVIEGGFISIVFYILSPCSLLWAAVVMLASLLWCPRYYLCPLLYSKVYHCIHFGRSFIVWICLALCVSSV